MSGLPEQDRGGAFAVATHGLSKRYGSETALAGVDLRVPEGAVYILIGSNGAGKSTALKVLMNLERPDAGRAEVFGLDTASRGPEVRAQVGYVPEQHAPGYRWMTCGRLIQHVAAYYPAWDDAYADHLIAVFGVRLQRKVGSLSKGEARRLQLVLALAHRPPLLLLDEPTDGLDPVVRKRTLALLAEHLADTPTTVADRDAPHPRGREPRRSRRRAPRGAPGRADDARRAARTVGATASRCRRGGNRRPSFGSRASGARAPAAKCSGRWSANRAT